MWDAYMTCFHNLQVSAAEVRQLEKQLADYNKTESLKASLQQQLEGLHAKVCGNATTIALNSVLCRCNCLCVHPSCLLTCGCDMTMNDVT